MGFVKLYSKSEPIVRGVPICNNSLKKVFRCVIRLATADGAGRIET